MPGGLRPFADVIKDAKRSDGIADRLAEGRQGLARAQARRLQPPFFLSPKLKTGIGERGFYGGLMQDSGIVEFRRVHNQVQLIWRNVGYIAKPGTPEARAIEAGYSPSLLASAPVLSLPEPERKSVLVEANTLFLADLLGFGMDLQRDLSPGLRVRSAQLGDHPGAADAPTSLVLEVLGHYATGSIAVPQPGTPPGAPQPSAPRIAARPAQPVPDHHTIRSRRLPAEPMHGRRADPRVGYFESGRFDFSNDLQRTPRQRFVNRWRLEKKDPDAALSEPVKPIVFWIDRTVPFKYRAVDHRRRARMEQGVREDRLQERGAGRGPARRTPTSTRSTSAARRSAG